MVVAVVSLDGGVLDREVHSLDLTVGSGMIGLGQAMLNPIGLADYVKAHRSGIDGVPVLWLLGELDAIIFENGMNLVGDFFDYVLQEFLGGAPVCYFYELGGRVFVGSVDCHKEMELALGGLHLGNFDVEEADGITLEPLALRLVA
jgi:hypothetical protein